MLATHPFVPFTRDVLTRIKNGATAAELGWDDTFYVSICRKHGLEIIKYSPAKTQATPVIAAVVKTEPAPAPTLKPLVTTQPPKGEASLNIITRVLSRGDATLTLPNRQAELLALLANATASNPMSGQFIAARMGLDAQGGVGGHIVALRKKLIPLGIKINADVGRGSGGYSVVDRTSNVRLRIAIVKDGA